MIKVIKKGKTKFRMTCPKCACVYRYNLEDIGCIVPGHVKCPCCGEYSSHPNQAVIAEEMNKQMRDISIDNNLQAPVLDPVKMPWEDNIVWCHSNDKDIVLPSITSVNTTIPAIATITAANYSELVTAASSNIPAEESKSENPDFAKYMSNK